MITWFSHKEKKVTGTTKKSGDDFVSLSSHELRSPLSIIKWYTEILLDGDAGPLTDDQRKYLTVIETSNQRAIDLVRSLLNISRLDLGTFSISPQETSFVTLVEDAIASLKKDADKKNVGIVFTNNGPSISVSVDKRLCSTVCRQIVSNALSFSKPGSTVSVAIDIVKSGEVLVDHALREESILVTVVDHGIGIPVKDQDRVFSKMFRASNVKDSDGTGSGLGLYIAKTIMTSVSGDIWFISEEGKGSTFYVAFPTRGMKKKEGTTTLD